MIGRAFHSVRNMNGLTGIRANNGKDTVMLFYKSSLASPKDNYRLEKKLLRIYTNYYRKVNMDTLGQFWAEEEPILSVKYDDKMGGF